MLQGHLLEEEKQIKNMNFKMAVTTYLSTIMLNVIGLNALIRRQRMAACRKTQDSYAVYKRYTLDAKTHTDWK